jgi:bacterial/archaeal transporter family protein
MAVASSIIFAFCAMLCWGIGDFLIQRSTRKIGNIQALAWIGIIGTLGLLPFAYSEIGSIFNKDNIILLLSLGVIVYITALFNFEALREGKLSVIDVILELELPITIILCFVFLKETLTMTQLIVVSFVLLGIVLIATESFHHWKTRLEKGVIIAVIAAILMGVVNFLTASSSKTISPLMAIWIPWVIFTILCMFFLWKNNELKSFYNNASQYRTLILWMGVFDTVAWLFYAYAVQNSHVSIITAITESYPAIAMFLGLWFNKEAIKKHQYFGAGLAIAGSVLLAMTVGN